MFLSGGKSEGLVNKCSHCTYKVHSKLLVIGPLNKVTHISKLTRE